MSEVPQTTAPVRSRVIAAVAVAAALAIGVTSFAPATRAASGPSFDPAGLNSVSADCGEVLRVDFSEGMLRMGLWNSSALAGEAAPAAPKIKF